MNGVMMEKDQCLYLGDGVYLYYDGFGFELRANDHKNPTDIIYLDCAVASVLVKNLEATLKLINPS